MSEALAPDDKHPLAPLARGSKERRPVLTRREFLALLLLGGIGAGAVLDAVTDGRLDLFGLLANPDPAEVSSIGGELDEQDFPTPTPSATPTPDAPPTPTLTLTPEYTPTPVVAPWLSAEFVEDYPRLVEGIRQGVYASGRVVEGHWNDDGSYTGPVYYNNHLLGYDGPRIHEFTIPDPQALMARMPDVLPQEIIDEVARNQPYGGELDPSNQLTPDELIRVDGIGVRFGEGSSSIFSMFVPSLDGRTWTERLITLPLGYPEFFGIYENGEVAYVDRPNHPNFGNENIFVANPDPLELNDNMIYFPTIYADHLLAAPAPVTILLTHEFDHQSWRVDDNIDIPNNFIVYLPGSY